MFNRKKEQPQNTQPVVQSSKYIEKYVITDPKDVLLNYNLFSDAAEIPVRVTSDGWGHCVPLPTNIFLGYLNKLAGTSKTITNNLKFRTVFIVSLLNKKKAYILPNAKDLNQWYIAIKKPGDLGLNTTPEINRAIVEQIKTITRS